MQLKKVHLVFQDSSIFSLHYFMYSVLIVVFTLISPIWVSYTDMCAFLRGRSDVSLISKWLKSEHTSFYLSCKDHLLLAQTFLETDETKARSFLRQIRSICFVNIIAFRSQSDRLAIVAVQNRRWIPFSSLRFRDYQVNNMQRPEWPQ